MQNPGLIVAPLTPFTSDLMPDEPALQRQIDYIVRDCRATMVVAAGVEAQEYRYLSFEQRRALIRRTVEFVDGRVPVMVGISHPSFKTAIELAHDARSGAAGRGDREIAAGDDYGGRNGSGAIPAGPTRRAAVAAAVLRADRRAGRGDVHHAAAGARALLDLRAGFENREMGNDREGIREEVKMRRAIEPKHPEGKAESAQVHSRCVPSALTQT